MKRIMATADAQILRRWRSAVQGLGSAVVAAPLQELERMLAGTAAGLCLVDVLLAENDRPGALLRLLSDHPETRFIFLSDRPDASEGWRLIKAGARGYCNRYIAPALLRKVVEVVEAGEIWVGRRLLTQLMAQIPAPEPSPPPPSTEVPADPLVALTPRERQIAALVADGASNKLIAQRLEITERTVKAHLSAIFRKTETRDRLGLALLYRDAAKIHSLP